MNALFGAMNLVLAASEDFQPQNEFELPAWVSIHIGPLDMSINKAVVYLFVGAAVTMILGIWVMRFGLALRPNRRQTIGESVYDLIYGQIAESSLPTKGLSLWFPYVAALFLFIWVVNLIGFIPLPISDEHFREIAAQHSDYDHKLQELEAKHALTEEEQLVDRKSVV